MRNFAKIPRTTCLKFPIIFSPATTQSIAPHFLLLIGLLPGGTHLPLPTFLLPPPQLVACGHILLLAQFSLPEAFLPILLLLSFPNSDHFSLFALLILLSLFRNVGIHSNSLSEVHFVFSLSSLIHSHPWRSLPSTCRVLLNVHHF